MVGVVGKSDSKENPKSDLDLDLGFVKMIILYMGPFLSIFPFIFEEIKKKPAIDGVKLTTQQGWFVRLYNTGLGRSFN